MISMTVSIVLKQSLSVYYLDTIQIQFKQFFGCNIWYSIEIEFQTICHNTTGAPAINCLTVDGQQLKCRLGFIPSCLTCDHIILDSTQHVTARTELFNIALYNFNNVCVDHVYCGFCMTGIRQCIEIVIINFPDICSKLMEFVLSSRCRAMQANLALYNCY